MPPVPMCGFRTYCKNLIKTKYPENNPCSGGWGGPETKTGLLYKEQTQRRKFIVCVLNGDIPRAERCIPKMRDILRQQINQKDTTIIAVDVIAHTIHHKDTVAANRIAEKINSLDEWCNMFITTAATGNGSITDDEQIMWEPFTPIHMEADPAE
jgi:hypothetical protein